jgi:hypothetical protein
MVCMAATAVAKVVPMAPLAPATSKSNRGLGSDSLFIDSGLLSIGTGGLYYPLVS